MTDAEINRALTEKVLGWEWAEQSGYGDNWGWWLTKAGDWDSRKGPYPPDHPGVDVLTWDGFGLLLKALVERDNPPEMHWDGVQWVVILEQHEADAMCRGQDPDLRRALRDAACKAYGIEVE